MDNRQQIGAARQTVNRGGVLLWREGPAGAARRPMRYQDIYASAALLRSVDVVRPSAGELLNLNPMPSLVVPACAGTTSVESRRLRHTPVVPDWIRDPALPARRDLREQTERLARQAAGLDPVRGDGRGK